MSDDKIRAEFEKWADSQCLPLTRINWDNGTVSEYAYTATFDAWKVWQAAYQAGRKAEREAIQRKNEEWSKAVNKAWIETANERESQL